jgi:putative membrane protein
MQTFKAVDHGTHDAFEFMTQLILALPFVLVLLIYLVAVSVSSARNQSWPLYRTVYWVVGCSCALVVVSGPLASNAHMDFTAHMTGHLFLGMLAPLLMVLAAPITLIFRTLNVNAARRLAWILRSRLLSFLRNPIVAAFLNIGSLWLLYTSNLYTFMQHSIWVYILVHLHVFISGYLFTASMIYIDPSPHRTNFSYRAIVLVTALACHGILSKFIYAFPPSDVPIAQAETGGMFMYYGGDVINLGLIIVFCYQWYKAIRPRTTSANNS